MTTVKAITGLSDEQIDELLRWFGRQPRAIQLRCLSAEQLAGLVNSAARLKDTIQSGNSKNYDRDLDRLGSAEEVRLEKLRSSRRKSPKASALWQRRALIKRLLKKQGNFTLVTDYLNTYEKIRVTPSYLRRVWLKWQENGLV